MEKSIEREKDILNLVIQEYIKKAKPISSELLKKNYKLDVCSATIRNDLHRLSEKGYLIQDYSSAGRVPTKKAYRLFVQEILEDLEMKENYLEFVEEIERSAEDDFDFFSSITRGLANYSCSFAFSYFQDHLYKEGWKEIIENPEFSQTETLKEFLNILEEIEKNIDELTEGSTEIKVYIGKEKDINLKNFSLIIGNTVFSDNKRGILALMGPERMDYSRNIKIINSLIKSLEKK